MDFLKLQIVEINIMTRCAVEPGLNLSIESMQDSLSPSNTVFIFVFSHTGNQEILVPRCYFPCAIWFEEAIFNWGSYLNIEERFLYFQFSTIQLKNGLCLDVYTPLQAPKHSQRQSSHVLCYDQKFVPSINFGLAVCWKLASSFFPTLQSYPL